VLAVDAAASHVELLNAAAARNGFAALHAVQRAISDSPTPVAFVERSIHGHVLLADEPDGGQTTEVQTATVDGLLDERGWEDIDLIKMDIEGMEPAALAGMRRLSPAARGRRLCSSATARCFPAAVRRSARCAGWSSNSGTSC